MVKDFGLGGEEILHSNLESSLKGSLEGGLEGDLVGDLAKIFKDSDKHTFTVLQDHLNQGHSETSIAFLGLFQPISSLFFLPKLRQDFN